MKQKIEKASSKIEQLFLQNSDDLFDADDLTHLRWAIRVSVEVCVFLRARRHGKYPSSEDEKTRYCIDSIRSAFDSIFVIFTIHKILKGAKPQKISVSDIQDFSVFKSAYIDTFKKLQRSGLPLQERLGYLVRLGKMQVCFVGLTL